MGFILPYSETVSTERLKYELFSTKFMELKNKIEAKKASVCVVGLGYIGLPLACIIADSGFDVYGVDVKKDVVDKVNRGIPPISENGVDEFLKRAIALKKLRATLNCREAVEKSDIVIIIVQTPIGRDKKPDLRAFESACRSVGNALSAGKLIIVESTLPIGAIENMAIPEFEKRGLKCGRDFYLAYSPERAIPTRTMEEIRKNSRIVGGYCENSAELAHAFYSKITEGEVTKTDLRTAEVVKLIENTYRDVNIALANEIALLCEKIGADAIKAIKLANKHPRVNLHYPGAGVGGHCLPKDPWFLINKAEEVNLELKLIRTAREVNESMPEHVLKRIEKELKSIGKSLNNAKITILGIAYKGNTSDTRNSPAEKIIERLSNLKCDFISHDSFVSQDFGYKFSRDIKAAIKNADCIVILAEHDEYKKLNLNEVEKLVKKPCLIFDGRRILNPEACDKKSKLKYSGIGYPETENMH